MAQTFNLPAVGDTMVEGEIVEWFVGVGETVTIDQAICSVETDKSVVEMTTPFAGTILALGADRGGIVEVGQPLIVVGAAGETAHEPATPTPPEPAPPTHTPPTHAGPDAGLTHAGPPSGTAGETRSPLIRRLAERLDVDLSTVVGSGPNGRITRIDVERAASAPAEPAVSEQPSSGPVRAMPKVRRAAREAGIDLTRIPGSGPDGAVLLADLDSTASSGTSPNGGSRERLSALRRSIGAHLTESATTIPQFTSMVDVDVTAILATRAALRERLDAPVSIDAVIMGLLIPVLRDHPRMNARLDGDDIVVFDHYDIGVAVDTPDGLLVPVVTDVEHRSIASIAGEIVRLSEAARNRSIQPHDLSGATCTLNNVGAVGLEAGTPILPVGTTAIIAPGRARPVVQLRNGNPVEVPTMTISATFDHRVIDGGDAGRFLTQLRRHLEVPALGLM